ncbi:VOC family protein [Sorangium sp. So ce381]|uniref:VOC family protein n=1 Tax=Sorangium sp. So ce381 TaxID=3133307 RepID=UPI003F5B2011
MSGTVASLSVHHLAVVVRDLARAEAFYAGVLGLPVARRWTDDAGAPRSVWLDLGGGAFLAVERAEAAGPTRADEAPGWHCVALGIAPSEREAWRRRLAAGGVVVERESAYTMYARDPDGNLVALSHYPHPQAGPS